MTMFSDIDDQLHTDPAGDGSEYWVGPADQESEPVDPDAPYGRNPKTGQPYKKSPEEREVLGARLAAGRAAARERVAAGGPSRRRAKASSSPRSTRSARPAEPPYREAAATLLQIPAFMVGALAGFQRSKDGEIPSLALDAAAISLHTPPIAEAAHQWALTDPRVAAMFERVLQISPAGVFLAAVVPLLAQIGVNHRMLPASMGMTPDQLMETEAESADVGG